MGYQIRLHRERWDCWEVWRPLRGQWFLDGTRACSRREPADDRHRRLKSCQFVRIPVSCNYVGLSQSNSHWKYRTGSIIQGNIRAVNAHKHKKHEITSEYYMSWRLWAISYIERCLRTGKNKQQTKKQSCYYNRKMGHRGVTSPPNHVGRSEILLSED